MGVPSMDVVNTGLQAVFGGGLLLLMVAAWWSWIGDGIQVPRTWWPNAVLSAALVGWGLFIGGLFVLVVGFFTQVGVARW